MLKMLEILETLAGNGGVLRRHRSGGVVEFDEKSPGCDLETNDSIVFRFIDEKKKHHRLNESYLIALENAGNRCKLD